MHYGNTAAANDERTTLAGTGDTAFWFAPILAWILGATIFFRQQTSSGFDLISGNFGDARLIIYINEHWFRVFSGLADFRSPSQFYPLEGTLGYSDAFFLYQVFYSPLRFFGVDQFLAFQLTLVGLTAIGFASFFTLLRRVFNVPLYLAVVGALIFAFSNMNFLKIGHPQHLTIEFIPLLVLFGFEAVKSIAEAPRRACLFSGLMGAGLALVFFTSYYIGWFFVLASLILVPVLLVLNRSDAIAMAKAHGLRVGVCLLVFAASFLIFLTPFLVTYLPVFLEGRKRSFADNLQFAGWISDVINVGAGNVLWGSVVENIPGYPVERLPNSEAQLATTPLLMIAMVVGTVFVVRHGMKHPVGQGFQVRLILALTITSLVLQVVPLQAGGYSLWWAVYKFVPGASAIRVPYRLQIMNGLIVTLTVVLILNYWYRVQRMQDVPKRAGVALTGFVAVLAVEQINVEPTAFISRAQELAFLDKVPAVDAQCRVFYVADSNPTDRPFFAYQIDAMLISHRVGIPTINGYSGWEPDNWALRDPNLGNYVGSADRWLKQNGLVEGACALDVGTMTWKVHQAPEPELLAVGQTVDFASGGNAGAFMVPEGWSGAEPWGRWTDGRAAGLEMKVDTPESGGLELVAEVMAYLTERHQSQDVEVLVNERKIGSWSFTPGQGGISERRLYIPADLIRSAPRTTITFRPLNPVSPKSLGYSGDPRHLGLGIHTLRLVEAPSANATQNP